MTINNQKKKFLYNKILSNYDNIDNHGKLVLNTCVRKAEDNYDQNIVAFESKYSDFYTTVSTYDYFILSLFQTVSVFSFIAGATLAYNSYMQWGVTSSIIGGISWKMSTAKKSSLISSNTHQQNDDLVRINTEYIEDIYTCVNDDAIIGSTKDQMLDYLLHKC